MTKKRARKRSYKKTSSFLITSVTCGVFLLFAIGFGTMHLVRANAATEVAPLDIDPNFGVRNMVTEFFEANNANEMIPIIRCESRFRHYDKNGEVLKNKSGSSATGVAQILASVHPDPKIITRYNRKYQMDMAVNDFDITTIEGNLGYALVLYQVNGVKDWECSKRFRF